MTKLEYNKIIKWLQENNPDFYTSESIKSSVNFIKFLSTLVDKERLKGVGK